MSFQLTRKKIQTNSITGKTETYIHNFATLEKARNSIIKIADKGVASYHNNNLIVTFPTYTVEFSLRNTEKLIIIPINEIVTIKQHNTL